MFLVVNILKIRHKLHLFFGIIFNLPSQKPKARPGGLPPNPTLTSGGRRGMWQNLSTFPGAECWVDSKASRVKCTTASPLTPFHLLGCSKTIRSGRSRNLSRLAKQPRSGLAFTGWRRPNALWLGCRVAAGVACTPATWRTRVWAAPTVLTSSPRGRVVGGRCAKGTHFRGYGFIAANGLAQSVVSTPMQPVGEGSSARQLPHRLLNYFQMLVQGLSMSLS